jgi:hypothetical protein
MSVILCPSCGQPVNVPEKKTGLWWGIGCLVAALGLPVILAVVGLLAAIAIPSFVRARETSQMNACIANLRAMETAKQELAVANGLPPGQDIPEEQLTPYLTGGFSEMKCPGGGTYTVRAIGQEAECSIHGSMSNPRGHQRQEPRTLDSRR